MGFYMKDALSCGCGACRRKATTDSYPKIMAVLDGMSRRVGVIEDRRRNAALDAAGPPDKLARALGLIADRDRQARIGIDMNARNNAFWHRTGDTDAPLSAMARHAESATNAGSLSGETEEQRRQQMLQDAENVAGGAMGGQRHLPSGAWTAAAPFDPTKAATDARNATRARQAASDAILKSWQSRIAEHYKRAS